MALRDPQQTYTRPVGNDCFEVRGRPAPRTVVGPPDSGTAALHGQGAGAEHEEDAVIGLGR